MKKTISMLAVVLTLGLAFGSVDAEAKRLGGGKSAGMQREMSVGKAPGATPAQQPAAPAYGQASAYNQAAAPAAAAAQKRSWLGPLAGIAAGIGLAALASHFGFGDELASMMLIGLAVMAVLAIVGMIMRRKAAAQQPALAAANAGGPAYADLRPQADFSQPAARSADSGSGLFSGINAGSLGGAAAGSAIGAGLAAAPSIPAGFDVEAFVRSAKVNFVRLQAANDAGNLDDLREFTTPEMFAELSVDIGERRGAAQQTEVVSLDAEVIEVIEEAGRYVASVRFTGMIREERNAPAERLDEVWHLSKPRAGSGGWVLSGIQQMQ